VVVIAGLCRRRRGRHHYLYILFRCG